MDFVIRPLPFVLGALLLARGALAAAPGPSIPAADADAASCERFGVIPAPATWQSAEVLPDGRVTFRLCAPDASSVRVASSDAADVIPMPTRSSRGGLALTRDASGLWSVTTPVAYAPDSYRYGFVVDGVRAADPQATAFTRERFGISAVVEVPGPEGRFQAWDPAVPHGVVSAFEYESRSAGQRRRAQVYTPPGYLAGRRAYPVLYLVHGAGDSEDSWTGIGRAHYILDNLIAAGKVRPMIVVMPFGHTPERAGANLLEDDVFGSDLLQDLMPAVQESFRTLRGPANRAMAGLSMGGAHTLHQGLTHPELFGYVGVFSMGLGLPDASQVARYEAAHAASLARGAKTFRLVYYAMGKDDFLYGTVAPTRALLDRYGIRHVYNESDGGHTWINWRRYFADFAPRLFR